VRVCHRISLKHRFGTMSVDTSTGPSMETSAVPAVPVVSLHAGLCAFVLVDDAFSTDNKHQIFMDLEQHGMKCNHHKDWREDMDRAQVAILVMHRDNGMQDNNNNNDDARDYLTRWSNLLGRIFGKGIPVYIVGSSERVRQSLVQSVDEEPLLRGYCASWDLFKAEHLGSPSSSSSSSNPGGIPQCSPVPSVHAEGVSSRDERTERQKRNDRALANVILGGHDDDHARAQARIPRLRANRSWFHWIVHGIARHFYVPQLYHFQITLTGLVVGAVLWDKYRHHHQTSASDAGDRSSIPGCTTQPSHPPTTTTTLGVLPASRTSCLLHAGHNQL
jgi:hypothetical protein